MGLWTTLAHTSFSNSSRNSPIDRIVGTILSAPWIAPDGDSGSWAVPLATLSLLIPFFFVSVWVERRVMKHFINVSTATDVQHDEVNEKVLRRRPRSKPGELRILSCIRNGVAFLGNFPSLTYLHPTAFNCLNRR